MSFVWHVSNEYSVSWKNVYFSLWISEEKQPELPPASNVFTRYKTSGQGENPPGVPAGCLLFSVTMWWVKGGKKNHIMLFCYIWDVGGSWVLLRQDHFDLVNVNVLFKREQQSWQALLNEQEDGEKCPLLKWTSMFNCGLQNENTTIIQTFK